MRLKGVISVNRKSRKQWWWAAFLGTVCLGVVFILSDKNRTLLLEPSQRSQSRAAPVSKSEMMRLTSKPSISTQELAVSDQLREAMEKFSNLPYDQKSESEWINLSQRLARECPEAGLNWLLGLAVSDTRRLGLGAFGSQLAVSDLAKAKKFLAKLLDRFDPKQGGYSSFARPVLQAEMTRSFEAGLDLLAALVHKGEDQDSYLMDLTARLQTAKNHTNLLKLAEKFPEKVAPESIGKALYQVWKSDPVEAQAKIDSIPDDSRVSQACRAMAGLFHRERPEEAVRWVQSMPAGLVRDGAVAGLAGAVSHHDAVEAARWIVSIEDITLRKAHGSVILPLAAGKDFAETEKIIAASGMPAAEQVEWLEFCQESYQHSQVPPVPSAK
jgi:hypothetical protein